MNKDSIFGYRDNENSCYRFIHKATYKIINPTEKILLYSQTSLGGSKGHQTIVKYFFSVSAASPLCQLSKWNIKNQFKNNTTFHELLDIYFHNDDELLSYDGYNNMHKLNHIYLLSLQTTLK